MEHRYRKRPIEVEAFQMTYGRRWDNSGWPQWLHMAWNGPDNEAGSLWIDPQDEKGENLVCGTFERAVYVSWDDWIIQGVQGDLYPCKPDIFESTYEPVGVHPAE